MSSEPFATNSSPRIREVIDRAQALGTLSGFALECWMMLAYEAGRQSVPSEKEVKYTVQVGDGKPYEIPKEGYDNLMAAMGSSAQSAGALKTDIEKLIELEAKATPGPYFVAVDDAYDAPAHQNSGLALIDTGRESDWPVLRLGEWPTTEFIAALLNAWPKIKAALSAPSSEGLALADERFAELKRGQQIIDRLKAAREKILTRRCSNPKPVGDSACECCTHHWYALGEGDEPKPSAPPAARHTSDERLNEHAALLAGGGLLAKREIEWRAKELAEAWLARSASGWIKTKDREPDGDHSVLASGPNTTTDGEWVNIVSAGYVRRNPNFCTHWQPLPVNPSAADRTANSE